MLLILNSNLARYFFTKSDQHRGQNGIRIAVPHCPRRLRKFHFSFRGFLFQNSFYIGGKSQILRKNQEGDRTIIAWRSEADDAFEG